MVSTHAPSFGVNNLLLQNFLEFVIFLDSKLVVESQEMFRAINTTTMALSLSQISLFQQLKLSSDKP
jgi:hypothetical protein